MIALNTQFYPNDLANKKEYKIMRLQEISRYIYKIRCQISLIEPKLKHHDKPDPERFTDARFLSSDEKRKTLKHWISFIKNGFPFNLFTEAIYNHLHLHCGYIAHYNRLGFYETYWNPDTIAYAKENSLEIRPVPEIFHLWESFLKQFEAWGEHRDLGLSIMFALKGELEILIEDLMKEALELYNHDMQNSYQLYLNRKAELHIIIDQLKEQTTKKEYELATLTPAAYTEETQSFYMALYKGLYDTDIFTITERQQPQLI